MVALVATGFVGVAANAEAKVRDPISRKTSPERGFFESRPSTSAVRTNSQYVRSNVVPSSNVIVSRPATSRTGTVVNSRGEVISAPAAVQPRARYIRVR